MIKAMTWVAAVTALIGMADGVLNPFTGWLPYTIAGGLASLTASAFAVRAATRSANRRARAAWTAQSVGLALWTLAPLDWLLGGQGPRLPIADAGRIAFLVLAATGFWLTSRAADSRSRYRMMLDGLVGAAAVLIMVWAFVLGPSLGSVRSAPIPLSVGYPMAALALVVFYVFLAFTEMRPGRRRMPMLFVLGLLCISAADLRYVELSVTAGHAARTVDYSGWVLGMALIGRAAAIYRGTTPRRADPPNTWWVSFAPYLALIPAGGTLLWQALRYGVVPTMEWIVGGVIVIAILLRQLLIVGENRTLVDRLRHQATHDSLTGLGNRALLLSRLDEMLAEHETRPAPLALMFIDLDDFKETNDTYGHHIGDQVLVEVGCRLRSSLRRGDLAVRLGGDEYAAVLRCSGPEAEAAADRLWQALREPCDVAGHSLRLSGSIGVAHVPIGVDTDADALLRRADVAMYAVKRAGKNGVHIFHPRDTGERPAQGTALAR